MRLPGIGSNPALRVLAVMGLLFFAAQLVILAVFWRDHRQGSERVFLLPLPARVATMVDLADNADDATRDKLVRAFSSSDSRVYIEEGPVEGEKRDGAAVEAFRRALGLYSEEMRGRQVSAMVGLSGRAIGPPRKTETGLQAEYPMRLVIELSDGKSMVVETPSLMEWRFRRTPVGLFAGLFGLIVAGIALWSIWNVVRPARDMAKAAGRFAATGIPQPVRPGGGAEMRGLVNAFNTLQERVAELLANRALVMSAMSHDVRTYLTRLRLRIEPLEPSSRDAAEKAINEIQALLDDTLTFAEAERGGIGGAEHLALADWLEDLKTSGQFDPDKITLRVDDRPVALVHPGRLERALVNIISNAVKYGGRADVTLAQEGADALITVADSGPGIPDAEKARVFEPFYRRDVSRNRSTEGAGLGLAIAKTIIVRQGGRISLSDGPGGGLVVSILLPVVNR